MVTMRFDCLHRSIEYTKRWKHTAQPDLIVAPFSRIDWTTWLILVLVLIFVEFYFVLFTSPLFFNFQYWNISIKMIHMQWFNFVVLVWFVCFFSHSIVNMFWINPIRFKISGRNSSFVVWGIRFVGVVSVYNLLFISTDCNSTDWVENVLFVVRCFI